MQFSKWKIGAVALVCMLLPGSVHAQIVKNERLLSFEEKQVPAFVTTAAGSQLGISDEHYRDGDHSLSWTFEPGAALSIKKDLNLRRKTRRGKTPIFRLSSYGCTMSRPRTSRFCLSS